MSLERPLDFNFDLFLFNGIRLERGLFPDDQAAPVEFSSHEACREYCTRYVRVVLEEQADQQAPTPSGSSRYRLDKQQLFRESSSSLAEQLRTGDDTCDLNLEHVRRDSAFGACAAAEQLQAEVWDECNAGWDDHNIYHPAAPAKRQRGYSIEARFLSAEMDTFPKELRTHWTHPHNLERTQTFKIH